MADETAASQAANAYFDTQNKGGIISISVAELVRNAGQQSSSARTAARRR
jgi:hypothetical protein